MPFKEAIDAKTSKLGKGKGQGESFAKTLLVKDGEEPTLDTDEIDGGVHIDTIEEEGGKSEPIAEEVGESIDPTGLDAEEWWSGYYQNCPTYVIHVYQPETVYKNTQRNANGRDRRDKSPLILIGSGSSLSVAGQKWLRWWTGGNFTMGG